MYLFNRLLHLHESLVLKLLRLSSKLMYVRAFLYIILHFTVIESRLPPGAESPKQFPESAARLARKRLVNLGFGSRVGTRFRWTRNPSPKRRSTAPCCMKESDPSSNLLNATSFLSLFIFTFQST